MDTKESAQKEVKEILKKYNLNLSYKLEFPVYNILPDEVKLALSILSKHGMRITIEFEDKKENK
jgi:hypothetical protein